MKTADRIVAVGGAISTMRLQRAAYLRGLRHGVVLTLALLAILFMTVACGGESVNTDPRIGVVDIRKDGNLMGYKFCDGTTLVYHGRASGVATVPNSPECQS